MRMLKRVPSVTELLVWTVLAAVPSAVGAQQAPSPEPLPEKLRTVWEATGFQTGWTSQSQTGYRYLVFVQGQGMGNDDVPAFRLKE